MFQNFHELVQQAIDNRRKQDNIEDNSFHLYPLFDRRRAFLFYTAVESAENPENPDNVDEHCTCWQSI